MITIFLATHIVLALVTCVAAASSLWQTSQHSLYVHRALSVMWASFAGVAVSGVGLIIALPGSLGRACVMMSLFVVLASAVQLYHYRTFARI